MSIERKNNNFGEKSIKFSKTKINLDIFSSLFFQSSFEENLEFYTKAELKKSAQIVIDSLFAHQKSKPTVHICNDSVKKGDESLCTITIINENKPLLLETLLNLFHEKKIKIELLAHPIFTVQSSSNDFEYELSLEQQCDISQKRKYKSSNAPQDSNATPLRRLSIIQFHIPNLSESLEIELKEDILKALEKVYLVVQDFPSMIDESKKIVSRYKQIAEKNTQFQEIASQIEELFNWLHADNFTFFGMSEYHYTYESETKFWKENIEYGLLKDKSFELSPHIDIDSLFKENSEFSIKMIEDHFIRARKVNIKSFVHRHVFLDSIDILLLNDKGKPCGSLAILGTFSTNAYTCSIFTIPYLRTKVENAFSQLGFCLEDYSGKVLVDILETYPRDEIFHTDMESLVKNLNLLLDLSTQPKIRTLVHFDCHTGLVSVLVYLPRDLYNTDNCKKIGEYLLKIYDGDHCEDHPLFVSYGLMRVHYIIHYKDDSSFISYPREKLEHDIQLLTKNWSHALENAAKKRKIDNHFVKIAENFPYYYQDRFSVDDALDDAHCIESLSHDKSLIVNFYKQKRYRKERLGVKIFHADKEMPLSERIPLLENMGFRSLSERSYGLPDGRGGRVFFHDMRLEKIYATDTDLLSINENLSQAFIAIWLKNADNDAFNGLVQTARMEWRQIVILRAYGRYLQQIGIPYTQDRLARSLNEYPEIARYLYDLFSLKFDPNQSRYDNAKNEENLHNFIEKSLKNVPNLDDDLILRRFHNLISSSLRSNAFLPEDDGSLRRTLAIKLNPKEIVGLVEPRPFREIFVYGPEVEGVHLRFGKIARGGIRWSDRELDYRTEILGLVKAQQVKNAVIVPVGAKGGFCPHNLPQTESRAEIQEAARQAYILYISAMLSITDNIINGEVVSPENLICHDEKDPYFVVAADKGTATFSDTANQISQSKDFWLDDAFASGGSDGYDHKAMGITAKGAWEAVKRHFRELMNRNIQKEDFTVVGVGDMSGDVFGNGLLLSRHARLIAAFDHRDIFIDPNPNPEISYQERERLFHLQRSSWQDYDRTKLSPGGDIYSRSQKMITLSQEAAAAIGFEKLSGTSYEIMSAILKSEVDLLWFGGIGTYVRAQTETNTEVGDRTNDMIRITGREVGAKIIGEGANLGLTQQGRIEYSLNNGRCDTDAIDNSAGVNCSDVEVNIKIALAEAMRQKKLTREKRNQLLKSMVKDVEKLVLKNNYIQPLTLSLAEEEGAKALPYQSLFMQSLEKRGLLDRKIELLPLDSQIQDYINSGQGLTRPEISVLLAYAKLTLQEDLTHSQLIQDEYFRDVLVNYFPCQMQKEFEQEILNHPLSHEIIATNLANDIVNRAGAVFVNHLQEKTNSSVEEIIKAYIIVRDGFKLLELYEDIDALDNKISGRIQNQLYSDIGKILFTATDSALYNDLNAGTIKNYVERVQNTYNIISKQFSCVIPEAMIAQFEEKIQNYQNMGLSVDLSKKLAISLISTNIPQITAIIDQLKGDAEKIIKIYFTLAERLGIFLLNNASQNMTLLDYYDSLALAEANDRVSQSIQKLVIQIYNQYSSEELPVDAWLNHEGVKFEAIISRLCGLLQCDLNISRFIVASSMLESLVRESA